MSVNAIKNKTRIVAAILVFSNILFNCLHGPIKKREDKSEQILPKEKKIANL